MYLFMKDQSNIIFGFFSKQSEEANWSGSAQFVIKYVNFYQKTRSSNLISWKLKVGVAS